MTATAEKNTILVKIRKLFNKAESAHELGSMEEATAFAAKAQELLAEHELDMTDVDYAHALEEDKMASQYVYPHGKDGKEKWKKSRCAWSEALAGHVAQAHFCKVMVSTGSNGMYFVGRESHREVATYVWQRLCGEIERLCEQEYNKAWAAHGSGARGFPAAFRNEFVKVVQERYRAEREARRQDLEDSGNGVALIRLDNASEAAARYIQEEIKISRAAGLKGQWSSNAAGREKGREYGSRANLSGNGIRGNNAPGTKLLG